jgi:RimJ/RimL family protein N-acetyltransferase
LAVCRSDELIAAVVFYNMTNTNIEMAAVSIYPLWLNRSILGSIFRYPFEQLECDRITTRVRADNVHSMRITEKLGFIREGTMREALDGYDVHVYGMLRRECRWI